MKALSPFISTALIIMMGIAVISIVLAVVMPALDRARDASVADEALANLEMIDDVVKEVISEGEGSKRTINVKVGNGIYEVDPIVDSLNFTYELKTDFALSGRRGNVNVTTSMGKLSMNILYSNVDLTGSDHFSKGDHSVSIVNNGTNSTTDYPMIYVGRERGEEE